MTQPPVGNQGCRSPGLGGILLRGSAYYRDPNAALSSLWDRLENLGIQPSPEAALPNNYTETPRCDAKRA